MKRPPFASGDVVLVAWPGASDGSGTKRVRVHAIRAADFLGWVARTTPKGEYTGDYGSSLRAFPLADFRAVVALRALDEGSR